MGHPSPPLALLFTVLISTIITPIRAVEMNGLPRPQRQLLQRGINRSPDPKQGTLYPPPPPPPETPPPPPPPVPIPDLPPPAFEPGMPPRRLARRLLDEDVNQWAQVESAASATISALAPSEPAEAPGLAAAKYASVRTNTQRMLREHFPSRFSRYPSKDNPFEDDLVEGSEEHSSQTLLLTLLNAAKSTLSLKLPNTAWKDAVAGGDADAVLPEDAELVLGNGGRQVREALARKQPAQKFPQPFASAMQQVAPPPSRFWGPNIKAPYPTNRFFQNYVLDQGTVDSRPTHGGLQEIIHPYLIRSEPVTGGFSFCYPKITASSISVWRTFKADVSVSCAEGLAPHKLTSYDDLSATLQWGTQMSTPLVRGSPYVTIIFGQGCKPSFSTANYIVSATPNPTKTKYTIMLADGQQYALYSSSPLNLVGGSGDPLVAQSPFQGVVRMAVVIGNDTDKNLLDTYASTYPVGGTSTITQTGQLMYSFKTKSWDGSNRLLMLSLPHHRKIMAVPGPSARGGLAYAAPEGVTEGVIGREWFLRFKLPVIQWRANSPVPPSARGELLEALNTDVANLQEVSATACYWAGKSLARIARLALVAEELGSDKLNTILGFLRRGLTAWFTGTVPGNSFLYDPVYGGIITAVSLNGRLEEYGLGMYNDHHFQYGYFVYAGAVLAKMDKAWAASFKPHLYALAQDYITLSAKNPLFPRLRHFDTWALHSWASGLFPFPDGRNQEASSEAVNAYYAAALLGLAYKNKPLFDFGRALTALEIYGAQSLWHVPEKSGVYPAPFAVPNRIIGNLWSSKVDANLWFAAAKELAIRVGIQVIPITPISESLFLHSTSYLKSVVDWVSTMPGWADGSAASESWLGFVYAVQATYDREGALALVRTLTEFDSGNSRTNMLYWIFTRNLAVLANAA